MRYKRIAAAAPRRKPSLETALAFLMPPLQHLRRQFRHWYIDAVNSNPIKTTSKSFGGLVLNLSFSIKEIPVEE